MEFSAILALLVTFLITLHFLMSWWRQTRRYKSLPDGPTPLPFLGTPKYMNIRAADKNYTMLSQKYGSIFTIWKLSEPVVVLCGYETVKDALLNHAEEFSARPIIPTLHFPDQGYGSRLAGNSGVRIILHGRESTKWWRGISGPRWRSLRRFAISSLRNFGMGKKTMESRVLEEATYLTQAAAETEGKPFNPLLIVASAVGNIVSSVLFGEHFDYSNPKLHDLMSHTSRHIRNFSSTLHTACNVFPLLLKLPFFAKFIFRENAYLNNFVLKYIEEHKRTLNPEAPRDLIDYFLLKMKEVEHEEDPDFCDTSLLSVVVGLLAAGSETTASSLKFCLVFFAHYPDVQAKVQQEIDEVTQSLRFPGIEDRPQLAYTNAAIHEIQRVLDLAPTALFHAVTKDMHFRGYTLPKGTIIIPFLSSVLNDPSQWETPEQFNPGHFLDEQGQFRNRVAFMPFSAGKRVCAGESLARMELFLLISALLQKFTFKLPPGTERRDSKWLNANKRDLMSYAELCAVPRALPTK
ncbi:PREDICTED: cytochrome P450 2C29-like [Nanorana parkeri]|uniref:cytochrome P450 2C29-like n=1 Tax=Nanorana parkeri TaxID=125878 RepID=UPI000853FB45|nr:PREDICTED: cytochrome P450 2C29-like [Nanorana parkeri]